MYFTSIPGWTAWPVAHVRMTTSSPPLLPQSKRVRLAPSARLTRPLPSLLLAEGSGARWCAPRFPSKPSSSLPSSCPGSWTRRTPCPAVDATGETWWCPPSTRSSDTSTGLRPSDYTRTPSQRFSGSTITAWLQTAKVIQLLLTPFSPSPSLKRP